MKIEIELPLDLGDDGDYYAQIWADSIKKAIDLTVKQYFENHEPDRKVTFEQFSHTYTEAYMDYQHNTTDESTALMAALCWNMIIDLEIQKTLGLEE